MVSLKNNQMESLLKEQEALKDYNVNIRNADSAVDQGLSRHSRMLQAGIQNLWSWMSTVAGMTRFLETVPSFCLARNSDRCLAMATAQLQNPDLEKLFRSVSTTFY